jgi:hypothetical protein
MKGGVMFSLCPVPPFYIKCNDPGAELPLMKYLLTREDIMRAVKKMHIEIFPEALFRDLHKTLLLALKIKKAMRGKELRIIVNTTVRDFKIYNVDTFK